MKILNLYAGIGGNRKLWNSIGEGDLHVTAVEYNEEIAGIYKDLYPNDEVIVADAHEYLLKNFKRFDFIWASPPCPSHSRMRYLTTKHVTGNPGLDREIVYADMKLYQEIILLENYFEGKWVIENVIPYYKPLISAKKIARHLFWSNFNLGNFEGDEANIRHNGISELQGKHGIDLSKYKIKHRKDQILRNCVDPELGLYIFNCARNIITKGRATQAELF